MSGEKVIYIPRPSAIYEEYALFPVAYIKRLWRSYNKRLKKMPFNLENAEERISAWYHLMVFTENLKTRGSWNYKKHKPAQEEEKTIYV